MPVQFECSNCHQPIEVDDEYAGQSAACPYCRAVLTVPMSSTFEAPVAVTARPAAPSAIPSIPVEGDAEEQPISAPSPVRTRNARLLGNGALASAAIAMLLFAVAFAIGTARIVQEYGGNPPVRFTEEETRALQESLGQNPAIVTCMIGGAFVAVIGLILALISLSQDARGNWRALVAGAVCGLFLLCNCGLPLVVG